LKIKGKFSADLVAFGIKRNQAHDGRSGHVDIDIGVEQEEAASKFGADFESLAFATMRVMEAVDDDDTDAIAFLQDSIKPGKRCVFERHQINIAGHKIDDQPDILGIKPVDGSRKVVVRIRIGIDVEKSENVTYFGQHIGETVKVEFNPKQGELDLPPARKSKKSDKAQAELPATVQ
jgi:hypothetical protein